MPICDNGPTSAPTWDAKDEAALIKLHQRRAEFMAYAKPPVEALVDKYFTTQPSSHAGKSSLCDFLIIHAAEVRDALQPWDSGVRFIDQHEGARRV